MSEEEKLILLSKLRWIETDNIYEAISDLTSVLIKLVEAVEVES